MLNICDNVIINKDIREFKHGVNRIMVEWQSRAIPLTITNIDYDDNSLSISHNGYTFYFDESELIKIEE